MSDYPVTESVAQYPCKCGHTMTEHRCSPDLTDDEPCQSPGCHCRDFWPQFESETP